MLQSLHVKNLALIDETEVEFREGLNILSGETGAGKSIIIGSINLALGEKIPKEIKLQYISKLKLISFALIPFLAVIADISDDFDRTIGSL